MLHNKASGAGWVSGFQAPAGQAAGLLASGRDAGRPAPPGESKTTLQNEYRKSEIENDAFTQKLHISVHVHMGILSNMRICAQ